jgi:periplasmic protein CpxP/Spy
MRSINRIFSILTAAAIVAVFSMVTFAQDPKTDAPKTEKAEKVEKRAPQGRMGKGEFGRMGRMGRMGMMGGMGRMGMMGMHGGAMRGLDLTEAQRAQIKGIREANKPDPALRDEIRKIHESRKPGTDLTAEQKARINTIRDQMRTRSQNTHDQILNLLTPEQRTKLDANKAEMKQRHEMMRQRFEQRRMNRPARPADAPKPPEVKKPTL